MSWMYSHPIIGAVLAVLFSSGVCDPAVRADLWTDYSAAVEDASRDATPDKISRDLIPIAPYNQGLVWKNRSIHIFTFPRRPDRL